MTTTLRRMTEDEYHAWAETSVPAFADEKVAAGQWPAADALSQAQKEHDELLPQGLATPEHHLFTVVDGAGAPVGTLWFAERAKAGARIAYVYDVAILPQRQREGHALRAFAALKDEARRLGLAGIALHVFGHNHGARALYVRLGFEPTNLNLYKPIAGDA